MRLKGITASEGLKRQLLNYVPSRGFLQGGADRSLQRLQRGCRQRQIIAVAAAAEAAAEAPAKPQQLLVRPSGFVAYGGGDT